MLERVTAADLETFGSLIGERHVDGIVDAEVNFAGIEQRQERARPRVRLNNHLKRRALAGDLREAARQSIEYRARRIGSDGQCARL